jgi:hypothetical protein
MSDEQARHTRLAESPSSLTMRRSESCEKPLDLDKFRRLNSLAEAIDETEERKFDEEIF